MSTLTRNGVRLHYEQRGDAGEPLLCIMGLGAPLEFWQFQTPVFARSHRVVVYDNRGVGRSDKPAGPYDIAKLADDALALLDACGHERAHVLGMSMGGMIAQELALRHPDRLGALVLASTYAKPDDKVKAQEASSPFANLDPATVDPRLVLQFLTSLILSPEFIARETAWLHGLSAQLLAMFAMEGFTAQLAAVMGHDVAARLHELQLPTLVMTGTADRLVPARCSDELARLIPGARLEKIEGGSHGVNVEHPDKFNRLVLDFLAQHPLTDTRF